MVGWLADWLVGWLLVGWAGWPQPTPNGGTGARSQPIHTKLDDKLVVGWLVVRSLFVVVVAVVVVVVVVVVVAVVVGSVSLTHPQLSGRWPRMTPAPWPRYPR